MQACSHLSARDEGFTFAVILVVLAGMSIGLASIGTTWHEQGRRDREHEILKLGVAYAQAIDHYYRMSPGSPKSLPSTLADLLEDKRGPTVQRHLRRLHSDPTLPGRPWRVVLSADGRVRGVYIDSDERPLRSEGAFVDGIRLPASSRYRDWIFAPDLAEP